jgi:hypothetical protein
MRRIDFLRVVLAGGVSILGAGTASAQGAATTSRGAETAPLPPGHPAINGAPVPAGPLRQAEGEDDDEDDSPLPSGHPDPGNGAPKPGPATPATFTPPADTETEDATLPPGTIVIELRDPENQALPSTELTLGMIHQSVAKGESREHKVESTDVTGKARIDGLETGSGIAYRITVPKEGATFAALPFQLPAQKGMHVVLHVYPVTRDVQAALVVMQGVVFVEVKDDRIQIEEAFTVFNIGKIAWVADGVLIRLPEGFTALSAQQTMSDQGLDAVDKQGGRIRGTFAPGRHELQFRWQLPYSGDRLVDFEVGLPPHVAVMRVIAGAAHGSKLRVAGFPDAERKADAQGQRLLVTEKQVRRDEPLTSLHVTLEGLPTPGPARIVATSLAGLMVVLGFSLALGGTARPSRGASEKARRLQFLAELADLERARRAGDVGPKTYRRARRAIIDAIAVTLESSGIQAKV